MREIIIKWERVDLTKIKKYEDTYFYLITKEYEVLYIGMSYKQEILREVKNTVKDFDFSLNEISLWLGYIEEYKGRITQNLIKDVECALIFVHKPQYNSQCVREYTGRGSLVIKNLNCPFLYSSIEIDKNARKIYIKNPAWEDKKIREKYEKIEKKFLKAFASLENVINAIKDVEEDAFWGYVKEYEMGQISAFAEIIKKIKEEMEKIYENEVKYFSKMKEIKKIEEEE